MRKIIFTIMITLISCHLTIAQDNVIDKELQNILNSRNDELIDVNIILKPQMSEERLSYLNSRGGSREHRRSIIINEMKDFAKSSQKEVLSVIEAETRNNNVTDVSAHWITNFINCKASRDLIYRLASHPDVASIIYNHEMEVVSDMSEESGDIKSSTSEIARHITQVDADDVWSLGYTGKGVIVAVLDSGVNTDHIDIKDHLWNGNAQHGYNVVNPGQPPYDDRSHGTHCAGIVCGDGTSGTITGAAPDATLMSIKLYDKYTGLTPQRLTEGIEFAVDNGADILSISQGWKNPSGNRVALRNTFNNLLQMGVVAAVAAGNDRQELATLPAPNNVRTPGDCPPPWLHPDQQQNAGGLSSVISVGAVDENNIIAGNSSQGPVTWEGTSFDDYKYNNGINIGLIRPDISAPGTSIQSLDNDSNNGYSIKAGTSMAAPCVAGVMALMLEKNPDLSPADLCRIIETTATKQTNSKSNDYGSGCINALAAVQAVNYNTTGPYLNPYQLTANTTTGVVEINLTLINNGGGSTNGNTNVTISTDDSYTSIIDGNESYKSMASNATASASFVVNISTLTPDNHIITFTVNATNGSYSRTFNFNVKVDNVFVAPSLNAQANGTSIILSWNATNNATSYNIYRNGTFIANTSSTSYRDENLEYSTLYAYTVTSKRGNLESEHSFIARVTTGDNPELPSPTNIVANNKGDNVSVSWNNAGDSKSSNIYRKNNSSDEETRLASNVNGSTYTDNSWNSLASGIYQYGVSNNHTKNETIYNQTFEEIYITNSESIYNVMNAYWYYYNRGDGNSFKWTINTSISGGGNTFPAYSGKSALITSYYNNDTFLSYLVSRPMNYTSHNGKNVKLSFRYITPAWDGINTLKVMISNQSHTGPWEELWSSNKTNVTDWTKAEVDISDYIGQNFYIAFVNVAGYGYYTGVDDVSITVEDILESGIEWSDNVYNKVNVFNKDGNWYDANNWTSAPLADANVIIDADAVLDVTAEINSLTINDGKTLTLNDGAKLIVKGDFSNSDAEAFVINEGAQVIQNNDDVAATFKKKIVSPTEWSNDNKTGWQFIASPVKDAKIFDFIPETSEYDLYKYSGLNDMEWINHKDDDNTSEYDFENTFQQGVGYMTSYEETSIATFKGLLNHESSFTYTLNYNENDNLSNFHLFGNPFSFDIKLSDFTSNDMVGGYAIVNDGGYVYKSVNDVIKVGEGFLVKSNGDNPSLSYRPQRGNDIEVQSINIIVSGKAGNDNVVIQLNESREGFTKLNNFNDDIAKIFVRDNGKRYGVYNCIEDTEEIELAFEARQAGNYSIRIEADGEFDMVTLVDRMTGIETNMLLNHYSFTATNIDNPNRFVLRLDKGQEPTDNRHFAYVNNGDIVIYDIEGNADIKIFDAMGRCVYQGESRDETAHIANEYSSGVYMIQKVDDSGMKVQKIVLE